MVLNNEELEPQKRIQSDRYHLGGQHTADVSKKFVTLHSWNLELYDVGFTCVVHKLLYLLLLGVASRSWYLIKKKTSLTKVKEFQLVPYSPLPYFSKQSNTTLSTELCVSLVTLLHRKGHHLLSVAKEYSTDVRTAAVQNICGSIAK